MMDGVSLFPSLLEERFLLNKTMKEGENECFFYKRKGINKHSVGMEKQQ